MRTSAGADHQAAVMASTSAQPAAANYIGLTANSTTPASGDTTLTGEFSTAGGGLLRKQATYSHTAGTSSYTLAATFTMNSTDGTNATPAKIGVFNAATAGSGTMVFETAIPSPPTMVPGDQLTLTETVNI